jgi:dolichol-phosphate mannosyltransferase
VYAGKIKTLNRAGKLGLGKVYNVKGSAYIDGLKMTSGDFVVLMDADLSHHPKYLPLFIEEQKRTNADIVTGTRFFSFI